MSTRTSEKALMPTAEKAIITWQQREITVTFDDVKKYLCPKASDQEIVLFIKTCQSLGLNPWIHEIYLVKYKEDEPAALIIATESYLKAAENCPEYDGHEAGIIIKEAGGKLEFRGGTFLQDDEDTKLAGGWAKVYRKDRKLPFYIAVNRKECEKRTREGAPTRFWREMPATMIRKVALSRALREAFPTRLGGLYAAAEYEEIPEGQLPPVLEKNGRPDWKKFWAKVKSELQLTVEEARLLLQVGSIKEELIDKGWTMEKIWDELVAALQRQKAQAKAEQIVDVQTGGVITQDENLFGEDEKAGAAAPAEAEAKQPTGTATPAKPKRDPESIRTVNDLLTACNQDYGMQPKQVYDELNVKSAREITEKPGDCYRRIAAVRG